MATWLALLTSSLNSHAAALLSGAYLGVTVDWLHFTGVAAWIGGLACLIYVLPVAVKASQSAGEQVRAKAVARFSQMALGAVGVIILTGTFQAWLQIGSWEGFVQTAYGERDGQDRVARAATCAGGLQPGGGAARFGQGGRRRRKCGRGDTGSTVRVRRAGRGRPGRPGPGGRGGTLQIHRPLRARRARELGERRSAGVAPSIGQ